MNSTPFAPPLAPAVPPDNATGLYLHLRQCTAHMRQAVDRLAVSQALVGGPLLQEQYLAYLLAQWQVYAPLEVRLEKWVPSAHAYRLRKARWLEADLRAMAQPVPRVSRHEEGQLVSVTSEGHAMGVLFVMEESTLGLNMLRKQLTKHVGTAWPMRFLMAYGQDSPMNWQDLVTALDQMPAHRWPEVTEGALSAYQWMWHRLSSVESPPDA